MNSIKNEFKNWVFNILTCRKEELFILYMFKGTSCSQAIMLIEFYG